jgi:hypothetical protein
MYSCTGSSSAVKHERTMSIALLAAAMALSRKMFRNFLSGLKNIFERPRRVSVRRSIGLLNPESVSPPSSQTLHPRQPHTRSLVPLSAFARPTARILPPSINARWRRTRMMLKPSWPQSLPPPTQRRRPPRRRRRRRRLRPRLPRKYASECQRPGGRCPRGRRRRAAPCFNRMGMRHRQRRMLRIRRLLPRLPRTVMMPVRRRCRRGQCR